METKEKTTQLSPVMKQFILHWGEMGSSWGINRAVAQIYALLYLSETPLTAEVISHGLSLARSTVSTGIRELQSWGLVKVVHILGDRRDHFEAMDDVWEMFRVILDERKRREIDPTLEVLEECVGAIDSEGTEDAYTRERLQEMLEFFELMTTVYTQVDQLPTETLKKMARLGDGFSGVLERLTR
jgi:DNA-binding transcriptional regulator GbsR (MarR family)